MCKYDVSTYAHFHNSFSATKTKKKSLADIVISKILTRQISFTKTSMSSLYYIGLNRYIIGTFPSTF